MHRPLFLTGMMGCGKTTVGRILARSLGVPLVDLDARIERLFGRAVPELFESGEARFRSCEAEALRTLLAEPGFGGRSVVVATGGGAILDPRGRAAMDEIGARVYLEVEVDELVRRLRPTEAAGRSAAERGGGRPRSDASTRPLLGGDALRLRSTLSELLAARRSHYRSAARCVDALGEPADVAERVVAAFGGDASARDSEAV